ncbi:MAG: hypothetical protein M1541_10925 [Acidobacteria bacterium]|nr:hypothetical protein [Acidobacteriota bacterium]
MAALMKYDSAVLSIAALLSLLTPPSRAAADGYPVDAITPHASVVRGPVNGVLVTLGGKSLAIYGDPRNDPPAVEEVLFTHCRRDVAWAGRVLVGKGAKAVAPAGESALFSDVRSFWDRYRTARFHDYDQQTSRILTEPVPNIDGVRDGDRIEWRGLTIQVIGTPGYTRGAVSYLFEIDGKRIACVGDLIYGDGRILDLYSLQDAIPETRENGYHGYGARAAEVLASLRKVAEWNPDIVIPARGPVIRSPRDAMDRLAARLRAVFASHFEIDALRWYRGDDRLRTQASRILGDQPVAWMPMAETIREKLPDWVVAIGNSRLIVSRSGGAYLVDCGNRKIMETVRNLRQQGRFKTLEGIYVTHYHNDHTDEVEAMAEEFHCPVFACGEMRDILEHPGAYRMPALTANSISGRNLRVMEEGARQRWHEFEFSSFFFPGQTWYHGALLVKRAGGETLFFIGDSFTPSGIDDYCLLNRNFVEPEKGLVYCLQKLKSMKPDYLLVNEHVPPAFRFSPEQLDRMTGNLANRRELLRALFPWDDPNFGVDEQWARFYPYGAEAAAGHAFEWEAVILNHSPARQEFRITPHVPAGWRGPSGPLKLSIGPRQEGSVRIRITSSPDATGTAVVTADVAFGSWDLREWIEGLVTVHPAGAP